MTPRQALPRVFRKSRLLIVGCGDVGLRLAAKLLPCMRVYALSSSLVQATEQTGHRNPPLAGNSSRHNVELATAQAQNRRAQFRRAGITALAGDLDQPASLQRLCGLAQRVAYLAPPPSEGLQDTRSRHLQRALAKTAPKRNARRSMRFTPSTRPKWSRLKPRLVYASTSGVYGDAQGAWVSEERSPSPQTDRGKRRLDAERWWRQSSQLAVSILRVPGIYAEDRAGGVAARLASGLPTLTALQDVYTNRIHADDLAAAMLRALFKGKPQRVYHVCEDSGLKLGDFLDSEAKRLGMKKLPRLSFDELAKQLSPMQMSFLAESRRLSNQRVKKELGVRIRNSSKP